MQEGEDVSKLVIVPIKNAYVVSLWNGSVKIAEFVAQQQAPSFTWMFDDSIFGMLAPRAEWTDKPDGDGYYWVWSPHTSYRPIDVARITKGLAYCTDGDGGDVPSAYVDCKWLKMTIPEGPKT
jgi:hypothetical protein